jgi:histidyl-tRNA synthetase
MSSERSDALRAPVGMHDVVPPDSRAWRDLVAAFAARAERFGYELVITPIVEHREVFERIGEATDVVRKEMYDFEDKGGRALALRPEGTAPVVRAYVQHRPPVPWKVWYVAPNFRYERPQKGRYRQHWLVGAEALGPADPALDVEMISFAHGFVRELGITQVRVLLNSMGDVSTRAPYVDALRDYFRSHAHGMGDEFLERVDTNPIRLLDAKREDWQDVIERAPQLTEHLSSEEQQHFEMVQRGLDAIGIEHELAPRLVRGLDYYTSTTFELAGDALDAAQNALGGGGRYDGLAEEMRGPPTPGIGFALGIERLLIAAGAEPAGDGITTTAPGVDVFVVDHLGGLEATVLLHELRESGLRADRAYGGRSLKAQMKAADRSGAAYAVVLAPEEAANQAVAVRDLRASYDVGREQQVIPREQVAGWLKLRLEAGVVER